MPTHWDGLLITWNATKPHYLTITLVVVMVLLLTDLEWQLKNCTEQISVFGNIHWGKKLFKVWTMTLLEWVRQIVITTSPIFIWSLIFFQFILTSSFFWPLKTKRKSTAASKLVEKQSHTGIWNAGTENQTVVCKALAWGLLRVDG